MEQPILSPARMGLSEYIRQDWVATAEEGIEPEGLLDPGYWSHVSALMKPFDHIEVRAEDGSWVAYLLVLGCDRNWAKVHILAAHKLSDTDVSQTQAAQMKHKVEWKGPHKKFCVVRISDSELLQDGIANKSDAFAWLKQYENVTA